MAVTPIKRYVRRLIETAAPISIDVQSDQKIDYSDIPALDDAFFTKAVISWPPAKKQVTVEADPSRRKP
jgi:hypothetical protein